MEANNLAPHSCIYHFRAKRVETGQAPGSAFPHYSRRPPQRTENLLEQLISDGRGVLKLVIQPRGWLSLCETQSLPNQWHKKGLELGQTSLRPNRCGIRAVFLLEFHLSCFPATKVSG